VLVEHVFEKVAGVSDGIKGTAIGSAFRRRGAARDDCCGGPLTGSPRIGPVSMGGAGHTPDFYYVRVYRPLRLREQLPPRR
jgi:hypothetical protein